MPRGPGGEPRLFGAAQGGCRGAARVKPASVGHRADAGRLARDRVKRPVAAGRCRLAADQPLGIVVHRGGQNLALCTALAQPAAVKHRDAVTGLRHHPQIVGDEDDRQSPAVTQLHQQAQDLGLHRHVECGRRLVRNQHTGVARQGHRDHRALPHPAGKLMRIGVHPAGRIGDAHLPQRLDRTGAGIAPRQALMQPHRLGDLVADPHHRVQMRRRVLEDHPDPAAAHLAHSGLGQGRQVLPHQSDAAARDPHHPGGQQAHQRPAGHRLARPAFPHQPEDLARCQVEGQIFDDALAPRGFDGQPVDRKDRSAHCRAPSHSPRPSAIRLNPKASPTIDRPGKVVIHQACEMNP